MAQEHFEEIEKSSKEKGGEKERKKRRKKKEEADVYSSLNQNFAIVSF